MTMPASGTRQVLCKQCLSVAEIPAGVDPHSRTWCTCCTLDHHHGADVLEAGACAEANHPGEPCWNPPSVSAKPDGCTICRPITHLAVAGPVQPTFGSAS